MSKTPKRLIEIDLPIRLISESSRWEKKSVPGHIKQIHLWWARRPLSACRSVMCASLWISPVELGSEDERVIEINKALCNWFEKGSSSEISEGFYSSLRDIKREKVDVDKIQNALLILVGDISDWSKSNRPEYIHLVRRITEIFHPIKPICLDSFAGGGSIPIEASRLGCQSIAIDINTTPFLLNKLALDFIPRHKEKLVESVMNLGFSILNDISESLCDIYPTNTKNGEVFAYIWAREIQCEGPGCGHRFPLIKSFWLTKKGGANVAYAIKPNPDKGKITYCLIQNPKESDIGKPTVSRGNATCPFCDFTTNVKSVRKQLSARSGGANDASLICIAEDIVGSTGRRYRLPDEDDFKALAKSREKLLECLKSEDKWFFELEESTPRGGGKGAGRAFSQRNYGMNRFADLYTHRQRLILGSFAKKISSLDINSLPRRDPELLKAVKVVLSIILTKVVDLATSLGAWEPNIPTVQHLYGRQAIGMCWDFAEGNILGSGRGSWRNFLKKTEDILRFQIGKWESGDAILGDALALPLPDSFADIFFTDPPYYDAIPYSDLSDLFYVWQKRCLFNEYSEQYASDLAEKDAECIVDEIKGKDSTYFERAMTNAMLEGIRVLKSDGIGCVVFANKSTKGWETQLQAMITAGWTITASWPIDTEMGSRLRAMNSAALASSIHLVVRPRNASVDDSIGDWRDVLEELPKRIHAWLPHLAREGVVGADAIFACLGPALEIFSRYDSVEKASGEIVSLSEYLEQVWAAVSREALSSIVADSDLSGFEADARLTAMWLWTVAGGSTDQSGDENLEDDADSTEEDGDAPKKVKVTGFTLEYDAARKIAQGLGASLEAMKSLVEVKGDKATLLSVGQRTEYLFGKGETEPTTAKGRKKKSNQMDLFAELIDESASEDVWQEKTVSKPGETVLDRVHQAMILFAAGRSEALKRFLVEDGAGNDPGLWKLAQALSALYPTGTQEKRWVDGVLARKKGLGF